MANGWVGGTLLEDQSTGSELDGVGSGDLSFDPHSVTKRP